MMPYKHLWKHFSGLALGTVCFLTALMFIAVLPVFAGLEEISALSLLFGAVIFRLHGSGNTWRQRGCLTLTFLGILAGLLIKQVEAPTRRASVWAKSTETALSVAKADSIIKANSTKVYEGDPKKKTNRRTGLFFLFLLGFIGSLLLGLAIFSMAFTGGIGLVTAYVFTFFDMAILSWAIHNLVKAVRKREPLKAKEMKKEDFKRERRTYFTILGALLGVAAFLVLLAILK